MLTALSILGVLVVLFLVAALATRESQALAPAPPDHADLALTTPATAESVRGLRFGLAVRGYRMSEVDAALDRLAGDLEERDRRIAELSGGQEATPAVTTTVDPTPEPVMPAPVAAEAVAPEPVVPEPVAAEAVAPEPVASEPVPAPATDAAFGAAAPVALVDPAAPVEPGPAASAPARAGSIAFPLDFPDVQTAEEEPAPALDHAVPVHDDLPSGPAAPPRQAPPAEVGQAPVEPVDPPPLRTP